MTPRPNSMPSAFTGEDSMNVTVEVTVQSGAIINFYAGHPHTEIPDALMDKLQETIDDLDAWLPATQPSTPAT